MARVLLNRNEDIRTQIKATLAEDSSQVALTLQKISQTDDTIKVRIPVLEKRLEQWENSLKTLNLEALSKILYILSTVQSSVGITSIINDKNNSFSLSVGYLE